MIHTEVIDGIAFVRIDSPPTNALTLELLDGLVAAVRTACAAPAVRAIVLTGGEQGFGSGVDLALLQQVVHAEDARVISRRFQEGFQAIEDASKPVVAALTGAVLGGAMELALACHVRVATRAAQFRLPEVTWGLIPSSGGTQRLPRLVGVSAALHILLASPTLSADEAWRMGLVDALAEREDLLDRCREMALSGSPIRRTRHRTDALADRAAVGAALEQAEALAASSRPELPAPRRLVAAVRAGLEKTYEAGILAEREALAECMALPAARHRIDLMLARRQLGRLPELAGVPPAEVRTVAVVGLGTMGMGIAQTLLQAGLRVAAFDRDAAAADWAVGRLRAGMEKHGRSAASLLDSLVLADDWATLSQADLVIESVFEDRAVKHSVLRRLEEVCQPQTVLATNTSALPIEGLAEGMRFPERLVGLHFLNPAHRMPLVEVIRGRSTACGALATVLALARTLHKTPLVLRSREGFVVTRLFVPYVQEAFELVAEGTAPETVDAAMAEFGFPMGPLALIDMVGIDVLIQCHRILLEAFPRHGRMPAIVDRLVENDWLGQKTGGGVYRYEPGDRTPRPNSQLAAWVGTAARRGREQFAAAAIAERLALRMVAEAYAVLEEGIVGSPADINVATVLGLGFPDFRGGVLAYADQLGRDPVRNRLKYWAGRCGERFALLPTA